MLWDPFAPEAVDDPPATWRELRERCPVARSERMNGFWVVSRFDDAVAIARRADEFNNSGGPQFGTPRPPLEVDRPLHTTFRRALQPYFTRERLGALEPRIRGYVAEMLQPALEAGEGDLAQTLTYPLPARVLCAWLGLPDTEWAYLKGVADELFEAEEGRGNDPATRARCNEELYAYSRRVVADRVGDLVQGLLDVVDHEDVVQVVRLLIVAGHNSTTGALGNAIVRVATEPEIQQRLRDEPALLPSAVEELLRIDASVQAMPRWANDDVELLGQQIRSGDRCILDREPNDHLTFGRGIHKCIGMDLARQELRIALDELLARTSWIELAGEPIRTTFIRRGVSYLPVKLHARA